MIDKCAYGSSLKETLANVAKEAKAHPANYSAPWDPASPGADNIWAVRDIFAMHLVDRHPEVMTQIRETAADAARGSSWMPLAAASLWNRPGPFRTAAIRAIEDTVRSVDAFCNSNVEELTLGINTPRDERSLYQSCAVDGTVSSVAKIHGSLAALKQMLEPHGELLAGIGQSVYQLGVARALFNHERTWQCVYEGRHSGQERRLALARWVFWIESFAQRSPEHGELVEERRP